MGAEHMTSNEVIMFYLNNLAHAKLSHKHTESVLDFVEEMSVDLLGYDICDKWGIKVGRFSGYNRAARAKEKAAKCRQCRCFIYIWVKSKSATVQQFTGQITQRCKSGNTGKQL